MYRYARKGEFDEKNIEAMKKLRMLVDEKLDEDNQCGKIQLMQIKWLKLNLNQFIGQME